MKKNVLKVMAMMLVAVITLGFASCGGSNKEEKPADLTQLNALISECQTLFDAATTADYPQEAIEAFGTVLTAAKAMTETNTQAQVDAMYKQLTEAKATFLAAAFDAIPAAALVAGFDFETNGETIKAEGKGWTGKLTAGPAALFGTNTAIPTFVEGRNGKGQAIHFANGSYVAVTDYEKSDVCGSQLSIAAWVKVDETYANNYIISLDTWNIWKLQIQDGGKPFFTFASDKGIADSDNEADQSVKPNEWVHVAVALDLAENHTLSFYVNGELTKTWTKEGKTQLEGSTLVTVADGKVLCIGCGEPYDASMDWATADNWNFFKGAVDELKVYNIALTEGQVRKLYNDEK